MSNNLTFERIGTQFFGINQYETRGKIVYRVCDEGEAGEGHIGYVWRFKDKVQWYAHDGTMFRHATIFVAVGHHQRKECAAYLAERLKK